MFAIDTKEVLEAERKLLQLRKEGLPYAVANTLNYVAFKTQKLAKREISRKMIEKNTFTRRSIQVNKARPGRIDSQFSEIGSTQEYMEIQEYGGTERKSGKHGVAIPTPAAAGQADANPRTRPVRAANRLARIRLARYRARGKNANQRLVIGVNMAVREKKQFAFLEVGKNRKRKGIYKVIGGRYKGRGWPGSAKLKMHYSLEHEYVRIPRTPWLEPATSIGLLGLETEYERQLMLQIKFF